jgi:DivIVA domain-containing protein
MPIRPEDIDSSKLPVSLRGYDRAAVDELLKRVAWDYRQALRVEDSWAQERDRLKTQNADLEARLESQQTDFTKILAERLTVRDGASSSRVTELEVEVRRLQEEARRLQDEARRLQELVRRHESRRDLTETLLLTAKRSATEQREAARQEAEALLKAAQRRAEEIERDARVDARHASAEIGRLQKLESDLRDRLRDTLEAVIGDNGRQAASQGEPAEPEPAP